ncbi:MAG: DUF262 domain-containing protein [Candidatus Omnitrophica bacterium]|nr:DUF262 domain-containing protein [Candidatus Omnitrophota bacterium]
MGEDEGYSSEYNLFDEKEGEDEPLDIPEGKRRIYTDTPKIRIGELYTQWKRGNLEVRPYFQRGFVWDVKKASRLIESILLDVPIPMIYTAEEKDGKEIVVDGQQRLISVFSYIDGIIPPENKTFWLRGLEVLKELEGNKFTELSKPDQEKIYRYSIPFTVIQKDSAEEIRFDIFERLNTGSVQLNDQELRNCTYRGEYNELLRDLAQNKDFQFILNNSRLNIRMLDCELILRFFSFYHTPYWEYKSPIKSFLNKEIIKYRNIDEKEASILKEVFKNSVELTKTIFGNRAFRRFEPGNEKDVNGSYELAKLNRGLFDIIMYGFSRYNKNQVIPCADAVREELLWLETYDVDFINSISGSGTDRMDRIQLKFKKWLDSLQEIVGKPESRARVFSLNIKRQLFDSNPACAICGQTIMTLDDGEVDHTEFYWRGGQTILSNARLVHRCCNRARKWKDNPGEISETRKMRIMEKGRGEHRMSGMCMPQEEYTIPILEVLNKMGGTGKSKYVIKLIGENMKSKLLPGDLKKIESGLVRWENKVAWQRFKMVKEGLLKQDSPQGIWEITEIGRKYLANQKL